MPFAALSLSSAVLRRLAVIGIALLLATVATRSIALTAEPGGAVEVREGDTWSKAEFLAREGRRYQIRYDDGTEEWVGADRLRDVGAGGGAESATAPEKKAPPRRFKKDQQVELKDRDDWEPATIKRAVPPLYLVATNDAFGRREFHWIWVGAERLRTPGEDFAGPDRRNQFEQGVLSDGIRKSMSAAKKGYAQYRAEQEASGGPEGDALEEEQEEQEKQEERSAFDAPAFAHPITPADRDTMVLDPAEPGVENDNVVDPAPDLKVGVTVRLMAGRGETFEKPVTIESNGQLALFVLKKALPGRDEVIYAEVIDLARRKSLGTTLFDHASLPHAVDTEGTTLAAVSNGFHPGSKRRLDLWDWNRGKPKHRISFEPFGTERERNNDIAWAHFATPAVVVVYSKAGTLSAWDTTAGRGLWEITRFKRQSAAAVSPGGRFVALVADDHLLMLDSQTGETRASLPSDGQTVDQLAFSTDGRWLAGISRSRLQGWDLENHTAVPSIGITGITGDGVVTDGGQVAFTNRVVDLTTGRAGPASGPNRGGTLSRARDGRLLLATHTPNRRRENAPAYTLRLEGNAPVTEAAMLPVAPLLQSGDVVTLDLKRMGLKGEEADAVRTWWTSQLNGRGISIDKNQPLRLVIETITETKKRAYQSTFGRHRPGNQPETVNVKYRTTRLALEIDKVVAWEKVRTFSPSDFINLKEGQSIQQAVNASSQPRGPGFLTATKLPERVVDPR